MTIETTGVQGFNVALTIASQDVSGQSNKFTLNPAKQIDDVTPFGVSSRLKASGIREWKGSIQVFYNEEANEGMEELWDAWEGTASVALTAVPKGTPGWTFSGSIHIADLSIEASPDGGFIMVNASFEGTGALTKS